MSCGVGLIDFALFLVTGSKAFSCQGLEQPAKPEEGKSKASFHIWCWGQELASCREAQPVYAHTHRGPEPGYTDRHGSVNTLELARNY